MKEKRKREKKKKMQRHLKKIKNENEADLVVRRSVRWWIVVDER
jgi:ribosomal protein L18